MAIKIVVSDTVGIKVKGNINDAAGTPQPFDFSLTCKRLDSKEIKAKIAQDGDMIDFMVDVVTGWSGVRDADDKPLPYSADAFRELCQIPGIGSISFNAYLLQVGGKEKN